MNYKGPRQRQTTLRWDYANENKRTGTYPIGYCTGWREDTKESVERWYVDGFDCPSYKKDLALRESFREKYHSDGHATYAEACECYRQFLLDQDLRMEGLTNYTQHKCTVCEAWTQRYAQIDQRQWFLCDAHCTREEIEKVFTIGESFGSY